VSEFVVVGLSLGIAIAGVSSAVCYYAYLQERKAHRAASDWAVANCEALACAKEYMHALHSVLERKTGGVGKRISECREIAETLFAVAPAVYEEEPSLIHCLQATDEFLVEVDRLLPADDIRAHAANSRSPEIYKQIRKAVDTIQVQP